MAKRLTHAEILAAGIAKGRALTLAEVAGILRALGHTQAASDLRERLTAKPKPIHYQGYDIIT